MSATPKKSSKKDSEPLDLVSAILGTIPKHVDPIEVRIILGNDEYRPTGGPNRGKISIGIHVDDSHLPEEQRLAVNEAVGKYKNVIFNGENVFRAIVDKTQRIEDGKGYITIPGGMTPNADGGYWINRVPTYAQEQ